MSPPTPASIPAPASFDSVVLAAVVAECQSLVGARVQRVHPLGPDGLALALRAAGGLRSLLISAHAKWGRICLVSRAAITPQAVRGGPTPFMQLTRSRLEGSTLRSISAPPFERLVTCTFETLEGAQDLIVEIMGRHSNLILCVGGVIVGALKHVSLDRARAREVLPQRPYVAPPQPRPDPARIAAADLAAAAAVLDGPAGPGDPTGRPAWRTVLETVGGIGPALAWETCLRAKIDPLSPLRPPGTDQVTGALHAIGEIVLGREFSPVLYRDADGVPAAYAAFPLLAYATLRQEPASMSSAVEAVTERVAGTARVEGVRQGLATTVTQAAARTNRALAAVAEDVRGAEEAGHLREQGELILAYLSRVEPGASMLEAPGFDGEPTRITLDPRRSGVENAQAYFKRYARAAAARKRLPERLGVLEADRGFLEAAANSIVQAETEDDLWEVEQDLIAAGLRRRPRAEVRPRAVDAGRVFQIGGHRVRVGRSARENDHLTFEVARPDDVWLHARGMPGAHVIVTDGQGAPGETVIAAAASIAAYYSAGRGAGRVPVDVAQRRFVRRIRGGRPGQVHYSNERTITVSPRLPSATGRNAPQ